jgi:chromosomal replication initiation ATPase DnaA
MHARAYRPSQYNGLGGGSGVVESWRSVQVEHVESSGVGDAIGNYAQELHPSLDIRYVRAAEFGRQFAIAAGDGQQDDLRSRYLDAGMLLVHDVQLLPGAEALQAEFLHVVTALHKGGRQLVISADRAPRLLADLNDSPRDRLERGLVAELANDTDGTA